MNEAKTLWLKYDQSFISLNLFEDDCGLLRSRTRISSGETIEFNRKCPILLLIWQAHYEVCHVGVDSTLNELRGTYWLI